MDLLVEVFAVGLAALVALDGLVDFVFVAAGLAAFAFVEVLALVAVFFGGPTFFAPAVLVVVVFYKR